MSRWLLLPCVAWGQLRINEVADKGSESVCQGEDWVELVNAGALPVQLEGYRLVDDKGLGSDDAFTFAAPAEIGPGARAVLCKGSSETPEEALAVFSFGIGSEDTINLFDPAGNLVDSSGELGGLSRANLVWARLPDTTGDFGYSSAATPGEKNMAAYVPTRREALAERSARGEAFFGFDAHGNTFADFEHVVELHMTVPDADGIFANSTYEQYVAVTNFTYKSQAESFTLPSAMRIRTRGFSTLAFPECYGSKELPFLLDFTSADATQSLFGVQKAYLRNSVFGSDYGLREWTMHRLLARFGLPYLRTRHVQVYINEELIGLYLYMEAVDQEYVFARSFPDYNEDYHGLYKVKPGALGMNCLRSSEEPDLDAVGNWVRGDTVEKLDVLGYDLAACAIEFWDKRVGGMVAGHLNEMAKHDNNCGEMLLKTGLVDRNLGKKARQSEVVDFINLMNDNKTAFRNSLHRLVDTTDWLKNAAVYAVTQTLDSPLGNGNNWHLASDGTGTGFKIVQYDHNNMGEFVPMEFEGCDIQLVDWSIAVPTDIEDNIIFGPLLQDLNYWNEYIEHVRDFNALYTSTALVADLEALAAALDPYVREDPLALNLHGQVKVCEDKAFPLGNIPGLPAFVQAWSCQNYHVLYGRPAGCDREAIVASPACDASCQSNPEYIKEVCPATCGLCDEGEFQDSTNVIVNGANLTGHFFEAQLSAEHGEALGGWAGAQKPLLAFMKARGQAVASQLEALEVGADGKVPVRQESGHACPNFGLMEGTSRSTNWCELAPKPTNCYKTRWCDAAGHMFEREWFDSACTEPMSDQANFDKPWDYFEWGECINLSYNMKVACNDDATITLGLFTERNCATSMYQEIWSEGTCGKEENAEECSQQQPDSEGVCVYTPTPKPPPLTPTTAWPTPSPTEKTDDDAGGKGKKTYNDNGVKAAASSCLWPVLLTVACAVWGPA